MVSSQSQVCTTELDRSAGAMGTDLKGQIRPTMPILAEHSGYFREPPDVGPAPTALGRSPPSPIATGGPFPQATALPSPSSPPPAPTPLTLFAMLREGATQAVVREGSLGARAWRGRASKRLLGPDAHWGYSILSWKTAEDFLQKTAGTKKRSIPLGQPLLSGLHKRGFC